jgi:hypothetical protein
MERLSIDMFQLDQRDLGVSARARVFSDYSIFVFKKSIGKGYGKCFILPTECERFASPPNRLIAGRLPQGIRV